MMAQAPSSKRVSVPPLHEYRFELEPTEALSVTLVKGSAEVFGFELVVGVGLPFAEEVRAAIWTSDGAELEIKSTFSSWLSLHLSLAKLRLLARPSSYTSSNPTDLSIPDDEVPGPRVMVVGERGVGKTSLVKTLANWRVRECTAKHVTNGGLTVVKLDVGEGGPTMPGTMSITTINSPLPTTTNVATLGTSVSSGPPVPPSPSTTAAHWTPPPNIDAYAPSVNSLVYWYGHTEANKKPPLYDLLLKKVGTSLKRKLDQGGVEGWKAGCIIDTPGEWAEKKGMAIVGKAVRELSVNILVVLGSERLFVDMRRLLATNKTVTVVRVPKNDGASEADAALQQATRDGQVRSFFYGGPAITQGTLAPFSIKVRFADLAVFRVGEAADTVAPSSALPIGFSRSVGETELIPIDLAGPRASAELVNKVLAVPQAGDGEGEEIACSPVLGFVWVGAVDQVKSLVTLLSPVKGRLPRKTLLLGTVDWQDQ